LFLQIQKRPLRVKYYFQPILAEGSVCQLSVATQPGFTFTVVRHTLSHQCCQFLRSFPQARDSVVAPADQPTRVPAAAANVVTDRYSLQSTYLNVGYRTLLCAHHVEPRQTDPTTHEINRRDHPARLEFLQDDPVNQKRRRHLEAHDVRQRIKFPPEPRFLPDNTASLFGLFCWS